MFSNVMKSMQQQIMMDSKVWICWVVIQKYINCALSGWPVVQKEGRRARALRVLLVQHLPVLLSSAVPFCEPLSLPPQQAEGHNDQNDDNDNNSNGPLGEGLFDGGSWLGDGGIRRVRSVGGKLVSH